MTFRRLRSRALWGGALLTGLLLAAPVHAGAEPKADSQSLVKTVGLVKEAIGEAEANGKIAPPVEKALQKLLQILDEEEREQRHHRRHHDESAFGAGFEQAGDTSTANSGTTDNSAPDDSSGGSTNSGASPGLSGSSLTGSAGNSPNSTSSSTSSKGNKAQNKQSQESRRAGHSSFAKGLRRAEREWREERREHRLERAFVRGLTALRRAEEHEDGTSARTAHSAKGPTGSKTSSATPRTDPGQTAGTSPKTVKQDAHAGAADTEKHVKLSEAQRKMAAVRPSVGQSRTGVLLGQHSSTAQTPPHLPTNSAGHASVGRHAGALAGTKHSGHKK